MGEVALVPLLASVALVEVTCRAVLVFAPWLFALPSLCESLTELPRSSSRRCRFLPKPVWVCPGTVRGVANTVVDPVRAKPRSYGKSGTSTRAPLLHFRAALRQALSLQQFGAPCVEPVIASIGIVSHHPVVDAHVAFEVPVALYLLAKHGFKNGVLGHVLHATEGSIPIFYELA